MKLSTRFAAMSAATLPVLIIAAGAALIPWVTTDLRTERDGHLHARADLLAPRAATLVAQSADPASQIRQALQAPDDIVVITSHGAAVEVGDAPTGVSLPTAAGAFSVRQGLRSWRGYSVTDAASGAHVWVLEPEAVLTAKVRQLRVRVWLMALFTSPVALGVGALLGRRAVRPLTVLRARAAQVSAGAGARIGMHTGVEEIDEVAAVLDGALARRDEQEARTVEAWQAARSFAATAAHELRTPLTGIQAALDVLDHPGADDADRREALADLRESHTRVLGLLEVLRALSRAELTQPDVFTPVDLAELSETAVHAARGRHPGTGFQLTGDIGAQAVLLGWDDGLRMVLDNLLDNAAVHGGPSGGAGVGAGDGDGGGAGAAQVVLGLWQIPGGLALTVDDTGPGIPDHLRPRIFERFGKSAASRGFGLGLAIVAQVVALHRGTVEATAGPGGRGARFAVRLPTAPQSQSFPKQPF